MKSRVFDPPPMTSSTIEFRSDPGAEPYRISPPPPPGSDDLCDDDDVEEDDWYMTSSIAKWRERRERDAKFSFDKKIKKIERVAFFYGVIKSLHFLVIGHSLDVTCASRDLLLRNGVY